MCPTLFLCYINDMAASLRCKVSLYADDSTLIASGESGSELGNFLSEELSNCRVWMTDNRLSLHLGKTECMLFGTRKRLKSVKEFTVACSDVTVGRVNTVKYLGYILDPNLGGNEQATGCIKRVAARLAFLYRNASVLDTLTRRTLCNPLIQPHIDYCITTWYNNILECHRKRLDALQRKMVRFIHALDHREHVDSAALKALGWLSINDRARYFRLLHVFRINAGIAPTYLCEGFSRVKTVHRYETRGSATNFFVPRLANTQFMHRGFFYSGISDWNALPSPLKSCSSESIFKAKLREHLFSFY